jgi:hypothetical protein
MVVNKVKFLKTNTNEFALCSNDFYEELGAMSKENLAKLLVSKIISSNSR